MSVVPEPTRVVIVGASLCGLSAAETLREEGYKGELIVIGDEPHEPYDRPPLSKQVAIGWVDPGRTALPRRRALDATWRLGTAATGLDLAGSTIRMADGSEFGFDKLLIATGTRARPWVKPGEATLEGVLTIRTAADGAEFRRLVAKRPKRVLVVGSGFTGSEIASACVDLKLPVTVVERGDKPLHNAPRWRGCRCDGGGPAGIRRGPALRRQRGAARGRRRRAQARAPLGRRDRAGGRRRHRARRGPQRGVAEGLGAGSWAVGRGVRRRMPGVRPVRRGNGQRVRGRRRGALSASPVDFQFVALEHWSNAVAQGATAAHNMRATQAMRRPHLLVPSFWSNQFGLNIKSRGAPNFADQAMVVQGTLGSRRFVVAYGRKGRLCAALTVNSAKWLELYEAEIARQAPFPPDLVGIARPAKPTVMDADFPPPSPEAPSPYIALTGHSLGDAKATFTIPHHQSVIA